jgi:hypothetical protein
VRSSTKRAIIAPFAPVTSKPGVRFWKVGLPSMLESSAWAWKMRRIVPPVRSATRRARSSLVLPFGMTSSISKPVFH